MDEKRARKRLTAERDEVAGLLRSAQTASEEDQGAAEGPGDIADAAQPLTSEGIEDAVADSLQRRLAAIDRALRRLDDGSYGRSVRSGKRIPNARLEADPAAELTIEEAREGR